MISREEVLKAIYENRPINKDTTEYEYWNKIRTEIMKLTCIDNEEDDMK